MGHALWGVCEAGMLPPYVSLGVLRVNLCVCCACPAWGSQVGPHIPFRVAYVRGSGLLYGVIHGYC